MRSPATGRRSRNSRGRSAMKTRKVLLATACALLGCAQKVPQKPLPAVRVEVVTSGTAASGKVAYSAVAQPTTTTPLAFRGPGYIVQILTVPMPGGGVRALGEGDRVRRGEVVARLRDAEYRDKVEQATGQLAAVRAGAEKARLEFERTTRLFATQSVTKPEMETASAQAKATQAQVAAAEAALEEARLGLRDTSLTAPVDGEVIRRSVELGAYMAPGTPAFVVGDVSRIKVVLGLPDIAVTQGKPGMIASVELGSVAPGAAIPLLPLTAFVPAGGERDRFGVMVIEGDAPQTRAKLRQVTLGDVIGNRVAVAQGLTAGERVITQGATMLKDNERVEVMPAEEP